ncbi:MAG: hypothetical protein ACJAYH_002056 [Celeribacter sp.]|jgi:hypothetical protein
MGRGVASAEATTAKAPSAQSGQKCATPKGCPSASIKTVTEPVPTHNTISPEASRAMPRADAIAPDVAMITAAKTKANMGFKKRMSISNAFRAQWESDILQRQTRLQKCIKTRYKHFGPRQHEKTPHGKPAGF